MRNLPILGIFVCLTGFSSLMIVKNSNFENLYVPQSVQLTDTTLTWNVKKPTTTAFKAGFVSFRWQLYEQMASGNRYIWEYATKDTTVQTLISIPIAQGDSSILFIKLYWLNATGKVTSITYSTKQTVKPRIIVACNTVTPASWSYLWGDSVYWRVYPDAPNTSSLFYVYRSSALNNLCQTSWPFNVK